jgi:Fic family protein
MEILKVPTKVSRIYFPMAKQKLIPLLFRYSSSLFRTLFIIRRRKEYYNRMEKINDKSKKITFKINFRY